MVYLLSKKERAEFLHQKAENDQNPDMTERRMEDGRRNDRKAAVRAD